MDFMVMLRHDGWPGLRHVCVCCPGHHCSRARESVAGDHRLTAVATMFNGPPAAEPGGVGGGGPGGWAGDRGLISRVRVQAFLAKCLRNCSMFL